MEKKRIVIIGVIAAAVIAVAAGVFLLIGRNHSRSTPANTVRSFVYSLNKKDVDGMLDCIEPTEAELLRLGINKLTNMDEVKFLEKLAKTLPFLDNITNSDIIPEFEADIKNVEKNGDKAVVTVSFDKESKNPTCYDIHLIRKDKKWYIQYAWLA